MQDDPLIEEARAAGKAYIDSFKGDRQALLDDLRKRESESGRPVVYRKPRYIRPPSAPATKQA